MLAGAFCFFFHNFTPYKYEKDHDTAGRDLVPRHVNGIKVDRICESNDSSALDHAALGAIRADVALELVFVALGEWGDFEFEEEVFADFDIDAACGDLGICSFESSWHFLESCLRRGRVSWGGKLCGANTMWQKKTRLECSCCRDETSWMSDM